MSEKFENLFGHLPFPEQPRIFGFDLDGKKVLGFDTGLNAQAFAQAKVAQFITQPGFIIYPDGIVETWQSGGVTELGLESAGPPSAPSMVVWGPFFPGERLDRIINDSARQDEALDAFRHWLRARQTLQNHSAENEPFPGPAGVFIVTAGNKNLTTEDTAEEEGTVFFPPARLIKRCLEAGGETLSAERWVHPDLEGADAISFSAGAMLYRIFCGASPFARENADELRQDIREGVFIPPDLAEGGLEPELAALITRAMGRVGKSGETRPGPVFLSEFIGTLASRPVSSWVKPLNEGELSRLRLEREQYSKKKALAIKTRRFMIRNAAIIAGALIALIVVSFAIRGAVRHMAGLPTTKGMNPLEVVDAYYSAFNALDHAMMEACLSGNAGSAAKWDIELAAKLFVIGRMRQAYEFAQSGFIPAQEWLEAGRPATGEAVFGITELKIWMHSVDEAAASFEAEYVLWLPESRDNAEAPPGARAARDRLALVFRRGAWRIAEINRESYPYSLPSSQSLMR